VNAKSSRKGLLIGIGAAVVVAVGAGALLLLGDDPSNALSTTKMRAGIVDLVKRSDVPRGEAVELDDCAAGSIKSLVDQGPDKLKDIEGATDDQQFFVFQPDVAGEPSVISCFASSSTDESALSILFGEVTSDNRASIVKLLSDYDVSFKDEHPHRGGTILQYCAKPKQPDDGAIPFCAADWWNAEVFFGTSISGPPRSSALSEEWLVAILPNVIDNVARRAANTELAPPTT
jgi:hypothetical protein